jgi:hypothetical protein
MTAMVALTILHDPAPIDSFDSFAAVDHLLYVDGARGEGERKKERERGGGDIGNVGVAWGRG